MPPLETTVLGRSGLTVTRLSAGGHFTDGPTGHEDFERRKRELHYMIDLGIRYHDVQWEPEEAVFADMLKVRGEDMVVAWPLHGVAAKGADVTAQHVVDYCHEHRRRYGLKHVDVLLWIALELDEASQQHTVSEIYAGFERMREEGFCDHFGFSCHHSPAMALRAVQDFDVFELMMVPYGYFNPTAEDELLPAAKAKGLGVVAMKLFGGGFGMMNRVYAGDVAHPELTTWKGRGRPYHAALRWVLRNPNVDCVVAGLHSTNEVDEYMSAAAVEYSDEDAKVLESIRELTATEQPHEFLSGWWR